MSSGVSAGGGAGIRRVALLDFDVHHGNGTQACVGNTVPSLASYAFQTPLSKGSQVFPRYKPWVDFDDADNILFARCAPPVPFPVAPGPVNLLQDLPCAILLCHHDQVLIASRTRCAGHGAACSLMGFAQRLLCGVHCPDHLGTSVRSVQGYGKVGGGWLYPGSGATSDTRPPGAPAASTGAAKAAASAEEAAASAGLSAPQQPAAPLANGAAQAKLCSHPRLLQQQMSNLAIVLLSPTCCVSTAYAVSFEID